VVIGGNGPFGSEGKVFLVKIRELVWQPKVRAINSEIGSDEVAYVDFKESRRHEIDVCIRGDPLMRHDFLEERVSESLKSPRIVSRHNGHLWWGDPSLRQRSCFERFPVGCAGHCARGENGLGSEVVLLLLDGP
jgi:hypothetical protein